MGLILLCSELFILEPFALKDFKLFWFLLLVISLVQTMQDSVPFQ